MLGVRVGLVGAGHFPCWRRAQLRAACPRSVPAAPRPASPPRPVAWQVMVGERGGKLYATDDRYCIDNGAMIAWPGLLAFKQARLLLPANCAGALAMCAACCCRLGCVSPAAMLLCGPPPPAPPSTSRCARCPPAGPDDGACGDNVHAAVPHRRGVCGLAGLRPLGDARPRREALLPGPRCKSNKRHDR